MHIVLTLLMGGITGLIVRLVAPGREPRSALASSAIGVVGAIVADYAIQQTECCTQNGMVDLMASIVGALILLSIDRYSRSKPQ